MITTQDDPHNFTIAQEPLDPKSIMIDFYSVLRSPMITFDEHLTMSNLNSDKLNSRLMDLSSASPQCGLRYLLDTDLPVTTQKLVIFRAGENCEIESQIFITNDRSGIRSLLNRWEKITAIPLKVFEVIYK